MALRQSARSQVVRAEALGPARDRGIPWRGCEEANLKGRLVLAGYLEFEDLSPETGLTLKEAGKSTDSRV